MFAPWKPAFGGFSAHTSLPFCTCVRDTRADIWSIERGWGGSRPTPGMRGRRCEVSCQGGRVENPLD